MNNDENNTNINPGVQTETPVTPVEPVVQPEVPTQPIAEPASPVSQPEIAPAAPVVESPSPAETPIVQPTPAATDVVQNTIVQPTPVQQPTIQQTPVVTQTGNIDNFANPLGQQQQVPPAPVLQKPKSKLPIIIGIGVGVVVVIILLVVLLGSSGGGSSKLVCTYNKKLSGGIDDFEQHVMSFNKDNYQMINEIKMVLTYPDLTDELYEKLIKNVNGTNCTFSEKCSAQYNEIDAGLSELGMDTKIVRKGNVVTVTAKKSVGLGITATSKDIQDVRDSYVKQDGWTCK